MSAASTLTKSMAQRSIVLRALRTPLSELMWGRITGCVPTVQSLVTDASMPEPLAAIVRDVTKRSRLWRSEKADVAMELIAHFTDGIGQRFARLTHAARDEWRGVLLEQRRGAFENGRAPLAARRVPVLLRAIRDVDRRRDRR